MRNDLTQDLKSLDFFTLALRCIELGRSNDFVYKFLTTNFFGQFA